MNAGTAMFLIMLGVFIVIVAVAILVHKKNINGKTKIDGGKVIIGLFVVFLGCAYLFIKRISSNEREQIIKNVALKTTITKISFDPHKPYFKFMTLADGQYLPMPEAMNNTLQIADSIYKIKGEDFYSVVNSKTKVATKYVVKVHRRVLSKPQ